MCPVTNNDSVVIQDWDIKYLKWPSKFNQIKLSAAQMWNTIINVSLIILGRQSETDLFIMSLLYFLQIESGGHNVPRPPGSDKVIQLNVCTTSNSQGFLRYPDIFRQEKRQNIELAKATDARSHLHNWLLHTFAAVNCFWTELLSFHYLPLLCEILDEVCGKVHTLVQTLTTWTNTSQTKPMSFFILSYMMLLNWRGQHDIVVSLCCFYYLSLGQF